MMKCAEQVPLILWVSYSNEHDSIIGPNRLSFILVSCADGGLAAWFQLERRGVEKASLRYSITCSTCTLAWNLTQQRRLSMLFVSTLA